MPFLPMHSLRILIASATPQPIPGAVGITIKPTPVTFNLTDLFIDIVMTTLSAVLKISIAEELKHIVAF